MSGRPSAAPGQCLGSLLGRWSRSELRNPRTDIWAGRESGSTSIALGTPPTAQCELLLPLALPQRLAELTAISMTHHVVWCGVV